MWVWDCAGHDLTSLMLESDSDLSTVLDQETHSLQTREPVQLRTDAYEHEHELTALFLLYYWFYVIPF